MRTLTSVIYKNTKRADRVDGNQMIRVLLSFLAFMIVFGSLSAIMVFASVYATYKLKQIEQSYAFVSLMLLLNFVILFAKSIFESLNVLFFSKDLKLLNRMPIKSIDIVHAKFIRMITSEYEMELIMLAIPMIVYGLMMNCTLKFYIFVGVVLLVIPIIPIVLISTIIAVIMLFTNRIKNKTKTMYITIIATIIVLNIIIALLSPNAQMDLDTFRNAITGANGLALTIANRFIVIRPIINSLVYYETSEGTKYLLIYVAENILFYIGALTIISPIYLKGTIGTTLNSERRGGNKKELSLSDFKKRDSSIAYILKEFKLICRSPIFLIECLFWPLICPIAVFIVALLMTWAANKLGVDIIIITLKRINTSWGSAIFLCVAQVFFMMNFNSIISFSKEGRWSILSKTIPIELDKQFSLKTFVGKLTNFLGIIVVVLWYLLCSKNVIRTIALLICCIQLSDIGEKFKLYIDLKNPKITWESEYTMMKQNTNVMYELFYTLYVMGILVVIAFAIRNVSIFFVTIMIGLYLINIITSFMIEKAQNKLFEKIY